MSVVDTLITKYVLWEKDYTDAASRVTKETKAMADGIDRAHKHFGFLGNMLRDVGRRALFVATSFGTAAAAGIVGLAVKASRAHLELDSLMRALEAVTGSADAAQRAFSQLQVISRTVPGMGLQDAVSHFNKLFIASGDASFTMDVLRQWGNAMAIAARGSEEMDRLTTNLMQVLSFGKLTGDELRETSMIFPLFMKGLKEVFGVANPQDLGKMGLDAKTVIAGVTEWLKQYPRFTGGPKQAFENLGKAAFEAFAAIGRVINEKVVPAVQRMSGIVRALIDDGYLERITAGVTKLFQVDESRLLRGLVRLLVTIESLPGRLKVFSLYARSVFDWLVGALKWVAAGFGLIVGARILAGFAALGAVIMEVAKAVKLLGIYTAITAIAVGGKKKALEIAVGLAVGAAAAYGAFATAEALIGPPPQFPKFLVDSSAAQDEEFDRLMKLITTPPTSPAEEDQPSAGGAVRAIAKSTAQTAENTRALVEMQKHIIGGGDLGRMGVTPTEMRFVRGAKPAPQYGRGGGYSRAEQAVLTGIRQLFHEMALADARG